MYVCMYVGLAARARRCSPPVPGPEAGTTIQLDPVLGTAHVPGQEAGWGAGGGGHLFDGDFGEVGVAGDVGAGLLPEEFGPGGWCCCRPVGILGRLRGFGVCRAAAVADTVGMGALNALMLAPVTVDGFLDGGVIKGQSILAHVVHVCILLCRDGMVDGRVLPGAFALFVLAALTDFCGVPVTADFVRTCGLILNMSEEKSNGKG